MAISETVLNATVLRATDEVGNQGRCAGQQAVARHRPEAARAGKPGTTQVTRAYCPTTDPL